MPAPLSMDASFVALANASPRSSSRVPLSIARLSFKFGIDVSGQTTVIAPNIPVNSAEVSSAPVKSSANNLSIGMSLIFSLRLVGQAPDQLVGLGQEPFQERRGIRVVIAHDEIDCRRFAPDRTADHRPGQKNSAHNAAE